MKALKPVIYTAIIILLPGCVGMQPNQSTKGQTMTVNCKIPVITPLPETKESQPKGGIEISIAPVAYKPSKRTAIMRKPVGPNAAEVLFVSGVSNYQFWEETTTTVLEPKPKLLAYQVKINNTLNRVFRGAGAVVQFNDGGKLVAVDQKGYQELTGAIVPPRSELQVTIYGPALDQMADNATVGLFFYDVVTATDAAGNTVEKQNYEWYFNFKTKDVEDTGSTSTQRIQTLKGHVFPR